MEEPSTRQSATLVQKRPFFPGDYSYGSVNVLKNSPDLIAISVTAASSIVGCCLDQEGPVFIDLLGQDSIPLLPEISAVAIGFKIVPSHAELPIPRQFQVSLNVDIAEAISRGCQKGICKAIKGMERGQRGFETNIVVRAEHFVAAGECESLVGAAEREVIVLGIVIERAVPGVGLPGELGVVIQLDLLSSRFTAGETATVGVSGVGERIAEVKKVGISG